MNIFIVNQNPESNYNDSEGEFYNYPTSIPNGKQVAVGDLLLFLLSSKSASKMNLGEFRITGISKIDNITYYNQFEKPMAIASYEWYKKFKSPLSFEQIGGEPRINIQHSINKILQERHIEILSKVIHNI